MKVATFNVNNINKRLPNLLAWLKAAKPDVVCLQELKASDAEFPQGAIRRAGYCAICRGQKTWNGVAILARGVEPVVTRTELPGDRSDTQSRYIEAAVSGVVFGCLYLPNGNPQPGPKFTYKLAWFERLTRHARSLLQAKVPVILAGDYNVVPTPADIYPTHSYDKDALVQPQSRAAFQRLLKQGWADAIRALHPEEQIYTYWDYMRNRWPRDAGLRLDHVLLSPDLRERLVASGVDREVRGKANASDHAPVWVTLDDGPARSKRAGSPVRPVSPSPRRGRSSAEEMVRPLLVIDGDFFAHRAYHALPKNIMRDGNRPAGAILGFANVLLRLYLDERPRAVLVAWDTLEAETYRHKAFEGYQQGREFDDELVEQLDVIPKFVSACGFLNTKAAGYEADDFLAAACRREERRGGAVLIASGDRDTFQLASPNTTILYPQRGGALIRIGPAEVQARYGVEPAQVPDFIALRGDSSDDIPGAPGVGAKGAAGLLKRYGSLERMLADGRFLTYREQLQLFRSIATMDAKAPIPPLRNQNPTWDQAAALAKRWKLDQLAGRLTRLTEEPSRFA